MAIGDRLALRWYETSLVWKGLRLDRQVRSPASIGDVAAAQRKDGVMPTLAASLCTGGVAAIGAAIIAGALLELPPGLPQLLVGLAVFCFPLLSTGFSYRLNVARMTGYSTKLEQMKCSLDEANVNLLETLGAVIDAYDAYTYGHSTQVTVYADALAEELGLSRAERESIVKAALIHDVGKIGVPDRILGKQGALTDEEFNIVKRHPLLGAEIIGRMSALQDLVPLVMHHHERWNGTGYPDGLAGEEIPLGARVLALADALDALCSDRPYRPTRSLREVAEEVKRCSGQDFDPGVVTAFAAVVAKKGGGFFISSAVRVDHLLSRTTLVGVSSHVRYVKKGMVSAEVIAQ